MYDFRRGPCKARTRSHHKINKKCYPNGAFQTFVSEKKPFFRGFIYENPRIVFLICGEIFMAVIL